MASLSYALFYTIKCSSTRDDGPRNHSPNKGSVKINGTSAAISANIACPVFPSAPSVTKNIPRHEDRQHIPTEKQTLDPFRQGLIIEGCVRYRQTLVIRSYEVGPDKTATLETMLNLLQETALNHVWMSGLLGDGFGATHAMIRNNLIWVVTRMLVQVDEYPIWGEVLEIDTWVGGSGKNGMRRDWLIQNRQTGQVFARATSTWVMMNRETRRLSKMPEEVRDEISPWFIERRAIEEEVPEKIIKLDDNAKYVDSNLKTIPDVFLENHELSSIILEYRRECGSSDMVQSICEPDEDSIPEDDNINILRGFSLASEILDGRGLSGTFDKWPTRYTHLLQIKGEQKNEEIVRGRTTWRKKISNTTT